MNAAKIITILLAEDNKGDALLTKEALAEAKFANDLRIVKDGIEAMEFLEKSGAYEGVPTPDLILLDLNMPRMNGHEVLDKVKNDEQFKNIPVVILTTSETEEDVMKSYEKRANCYITKPVDINRFIEVVGLIEEFWLGIVRLPSQNESSQQVAD